MAGRTEKVKRAMDEVEKDYMAGRDITDTAERLGVTKRRVEQLRAELRADGRLARKEVPRSETARDEVIDATVKTVDTVRWLIKNGQELVDEVREYLNTDNNHYKCEHCGCKGKWVTAQDYMAAAKVMDSLTNQLTLLAKVLGEITDAPQFNILTLDAHYMLFTQAIIRGDHYIDTRLQKVREIIDLVYREAPELRERVREVRALLDDVGSKPIGRQLYNDSIARFPRLGQRVGEFREIEEQALLSEGAVEGEFEEVE